MRMLGAIRQRTIQHGQIDESVRAYERAIQLYDEEIRNGTLQAEAWDGKGIALENLGLAENNLSRYDEALKAYDKAIETDPQDAEAWYDKAALLAPWPDSGMSLRSTMSLSRPSTRPFI